MPGCHNHAMQFSDLTLSRRLEAAEGAACAEFAMARRKLFPQSTARWTKYAGADVVFDRVDSPATQTFGLGIFDELSAGALDVIEDFFFSRGAHADHEVSPFAGSAALSLLCARGYTPVEISSVMHRAVEESAHAADQSIKVRAICPDEGRLWAAISARGWTHEHPELLDFLEETAVLAAAREHSVCFLAEVEGQPGAAGTLCIHDGVALFGGSSTVPEWRKRGLQTALIHGRMRFAAEHGCDLAMMVAEVGSSSQRNAERRGFRIAYTRTKWRLHRPVPADPVPAGSTLR